MAEGRPDVPAALKRQVLLESGHRCAIPTCRAHPVEICHIVDWATVKEHRFENLIALCPNCHTRQTRGEIDRQSLLAYKRALGLLQSRYSDYEIRVLRYFHDHPDTKVISVSGTDDPVIAAQNLLADGLLTRHPIPGLATTVSDSSGLVPTFEVPAIQAFMITDAGRDLVAKWYAADEIP